MTVHTCAHRKMPQHNIVNNVKLFSHELVSGHQYVHQNHHKMREYVLILKVSSQLPF